MTAMPVLAERWRVHSNTITKRDDDASQETIRFRRTGLNPEGQNMFSASVLLVNFAGVKRARMLKREVFKNKRIVSRYETG